MLFNGTVNSTIWLRKDKIKTAIFGITSVLSLGTLSLFCFYHPSVGVKLRCTSCSSEESDYVIINSGIQVESAVQHFNNNISLEHFVIIEVDGVRYVASNQNKYLFRQLPSIPTNFKRFLKKDYFKSNDKKDLQNESRIMTAQYGPNSMVIPDSNPMEIAFKHMLSPFFLFQYFSAFVWFAEDYFEYAVLILLITFASIYFTTAEEVFNLQRLKALAGVEGTVRVVETGRSGTSSNSNAIDFDISSIVPDSALVPGDWFLVSEGMTLPCDAVLVAGRVVVDESVLTGEALPVSKGPIDMDGLGSDPDRPIMLGCIPYISSAVEDGDNSLLKRTNAILFAGTKVGAVYGEHCVAVVARTGFHSAKGQLVASLLRPKEGLITFVADALWIILCMLVLTTLIFIFIAVQLSRRGASVGTLVFRYLDAVTTAVPPLLPASLAVATAVSIGRLKSLKVHVTDASRVNYAGMANAVCFDKTGTLTQTALQFVGASVAMSASDNNSEGVTLKEFKQSPESRHHSANYKSSRDASQLPTIVQELMATCHSLTLTGYSSDEPAGDPLEMELLHATAWVLRLNSDNSGRLVAYAHTSHIVPTSPFESDRRYELLRHFEFTPERLRSATLLRRPDGSVVYLVKGSPETIIKLCDPDSVPRDIESALVEAAKRGLRVIVMAARECVGASHSIGSSTAELLTLTQDQLEAQPGVRFLGLLFLSNALKPDAAPTIAQLRVARVHTSMITGDHVFTAISVAVECGIIDVQEDLTSSSNSNSSVNNNISDRNRNSSITWYNQNRSSLARNEAKGGDREGGAGDRGYSVYIVDEEETSGCTVIIDSQTNLPTSEFTLPQLILLAAQSYHAKVLSEGADGGCSPQQQQLSSWREVLRNWWFRRSPLNTNAYGYTDIDLDSENTPLTSEYNSSQYPSAVHSRAAREVHLAVTGRGLQSVVRNYQSGLVPFLVRYARVFARTKPHDKKFIVEQLMSTSEFASLDTLRENHFVKTSNSSSRSSSGAFNAFSNTRNHINASDRIGTSENRAVPISGIFTAPTSAVSTLKLHLKENFEVLFCGDGANDMTALRAASVGVSLCDSETSVAAPVTSQQQTPLSVMDVLKEGRCSLITAYVLIVYAVLYGAAQMFMNCVLYGFGLKPSNYTDIVQDIVFALAHGLVIIMSPPSDSLSTVPPPRRFLSLYFVSKLALLLLSFVLFHILAQQVLASQSFYTPYTTEEVLTSSYAYESTVAQNVGLAQLMIASVVATIGEPYRKPWYSNMFHVGALVLQTVVVLVQLFIQHSYFYEHVLQIRPLPTYFGFILLAILLLHVGLCVGFAHYADQWFFSRFKRLQLENRQNMGATTPNATFANKPGEPAGVAIDKSLLDIL